MTTAHPRLLDLGTVPFLGRRFRVVCKRDGCRVWSRPMCRSAAEAVREQHRLDKHDNGWEVAR